MHPGRECGERAGSPPLGETSTPTGPRSEALAAGPSTTAPPKPGPPHRVVTAPVAVLTRRMASLPRSATMRSAVCGGAQGWGVGGGSAGHGVLASVRDDTACCARGLGWKKCRGCAEVVRALKTTLSSANNNRTAPQLSCGLWQQQRVGPWCSNSAWAGRLRHVVRVYGMGG
jgi:hypothetical protein